MCAATHTNTHTANANANAYYYCWRSRQHDDHQSLMMIDECQAELAPFIFEKFELEKFI